MIRVLLFPESLAPSLSKVLAIVGVEWQVATSEADVVALEPPGGWDGAIVALDGDPETPLGIARSVREREESGTKILFLTSAELLPELGDNTSLFDDFCLTPFHPAELEARLGHLLARAGADKDETIISYGPLSLNVETYQAVIDGRHLDLTYMEYELLRYLASQPGKVFSREVLLSEVWGYDYYGGARTVDVHIRRLRSKMGEEHANLISTVRSVGYRLGQARWA